MGLRTTHDIFDEVAPTSATTAGGGDGKPAACPIKLKQPDYQCDLSCCLTTRRAYLIQVFKTFLYMGAWGSSSPKPTHLFSNCDLSRLRKELPAYKKWRGAGKIVRKHINSFGQTRISGGPLLKETQPRP